MKGYNNLRYKIGEGREFYATQYAQYIHDKYFKQEGKLLDIGCSQGFYMEGFRRLGYDCTGLDYDSQSLETLNQQGFKVLNCIAGKERFPLEDDTFDFIFCKSIIEHIFPQDIEFFVSEMKRVLKKGGIIYILTPNWKRAFKIFYNSLTHYTPFTKEKLKNQLLYEGFLNIQIDTWDNLPRLWKYNYKAIGWKRPFPRNIIAVAKK